MAHQCARQCHLPGQLISVAAVTEVPRESHYLRSTGRTTTGCVCVCVCVCTPPPLSIPAGWPKRAAQSRPNGGSVCLGGGSPLGARDLDCHTHTLALTTGRGGNSRLLERGRPAVRVAGRDRFPPLRSLRVPPTPERSTGRTTKNCIDGPTGFADLVAPCLVECGVDATGG